MLSVAIETSARPASVAISIGELVIGRTLDAGLAHASDLMPVLDRLLRDLDLDPAAIEAVYVGTGPGSYTGLRVGIATALGIARPRRTRLLGVPSGETLAYGELLPGEEAVCLLDARQDELYFAHYRRLEREVEVMRAPCVLTPAELEFALPARVPIFGDATVAEAARLGSAERARLRTDVVPRAAALLELGTLRLAERGPSPGSAIEPLYLRPFAARARRR